jgi:DNA-binding IclR family transcriptional regulator
MVQLLNYVPEIDMSGSLVDRALRTLEFLASEASGAGITTIAEKVGLPKSGAHRLVAELMRLAYVQQDPETERYLLTTKLLSVGFSYLSMSGVADVAQPVLDRLARESGELVRLTVVDGDQLTWVAKAQGARSGMRYDPEMGGHPTLFCTASGQAWLATLEEAVAVELAVKQGFGRLDQYGPTAPRTISDFTKVLNRVRAAGFATVEESAEAGTSAMAAAVVHPRTGRAIGTVSIAGPTFRFSAKRMGELVPSLLAAATELSQASAGSEFLAAAGHTRNSAIS